MMPDTTDEYFTRSGSRLVKLVRKHFHLSGTNENVRVQGDLRPASVESFYKEYLAAVRPPNLGPEKILPAPDPGKLRGLYIASPSTRVFLNDLVRHSLYVDQILVTDPFQSIVMLDHPGGVLQDPEAWLEVVVNKAIAICAVADWIDRDIVRIIPNPFYYNREVLFKSADNWQAKGIRIPESYKADVDGEFIIELLVSNYERDWADLLRALDTLGRPISEEENADFTRRAKEYLRDHPNRFSLAGTGMAETKDPPRLASKMISLGGGTPIHLAPEISLLTGSFMLFGNRKLYDILVDNFGAPPSAFAKIGLAFQDLDLPFLHNVPLEIALRARQEGHLATFRNYLRKVWALAALHEGEEAAQAASLAFADQVSSEYRTLESEWADIRTELRLGATTRGILTGTSAIVAGTLNWAAGAAGLMGALASAVVEYRQLASKVGIASQHPLAMFVELRRRAR